MIHEIGESAMLSILEFSSSILANISLFRYFFYVLADVIINVHGPPVGKMSRYIFPHLASQQRGIAILIGTTQISSIHPRLPNGSVEVLWLGMFAPDMNQFETCPLLL